MQPIKPLAWRKRAAQVKFHFSIGEEASAVIAAAARARRTLSHRDAEALFANSEARILSSIEQRFSEWMAQRAIVIDTAPPSKAEFRNFSMPADAHIVIGLDASADEVQMRAFRGGKFDSSYMPFPPERLGPEVEKLIGELRAQLSAEGS